MARYAQLIRRSLNRIRSTERQPDDDPDDDDFTTGLILMIEQ